MEAIQKEKFSNNNRISEDTTVKLVRDNPTGRRDIGRPM